MSIEQDGNNLTRVRNGPSAQTLQWSRTWTTNSNHESGSLQWRTIGTNNHFAVVTAVRAGVSAEPGLLIEHPVVKTLAQLGSPVQGVRTFISDSLKNYEDDGGTGEPYAFGSIAVGGGSYAAPVYADFDFWRYG